MRTLVISESAAEKLTSRHTYKISAEIDKSVLLGLSKFRLYAPTTLSAKNSEKLDDDGVIKKGLTVDPGDVVFAGLRKTVKTPDEEIIGKFSKNVKPYRKYIKEWEKDFTGVVTDVIKTPKEIRIFITTQERSRVGDKLCYSDDTEVLTTSGWKLFSDLSMSDNVAILDNGKLRYEEPDAIHRYPHSGEMYSLSSQQVDLLVTMDHSLYVKKRGADKHDLIKAREVIGKRVRHKKNAENANKYIEKYYIYPASWSRRGRGVVRKDGMFVNMNHWLTLVGLYVSEGFIVESKRKDRDGSTDRRVSICVHKNRVRDALDKACKAMGIHVSYHGNEGSIYDIRIFNELKKCGVGALNKKLPDYVFDVSEDQAYGLAYAMMLGDGSFTNSGSWSYFTSSSQLRDDFQRLCLHAGVSCNYTTRYFECPWFICGSFFFLLTPIA